MAKCRSDNTEKKQRNLIPYKPGQSGNPKGRPKGSRNKLSEEFFRDLCDAWEAFGKPALMSMAWTAPADFVRVAASLMPKLVDVGIDVKIDRVSDDELLASRNRYRIIEAAVDQEEVQPLE